MSALYENLLYRRDLEQTFQGTVGIGRLKNKKILITGSRGMIGSFLTEFLIYCNEEKGFACEIYAAGREFERLDERFFLHSQKPYLHFIPYEMNQPIEWNVKADYVIHAAGDAYPGAFIGDTAGSLRTFVDSTYNILNFCGKMQVERFLYLSSGEVYGRVNQEIQELTEDCGGFVDSLDPRSCYPLGKQASENLCAGFRKKYGLKVVIARPCHTYGPTHTPEDSRIASVCVRDVLARRDIVLKSDGQQKRSYCYIADCASGLLTVLLNGVEGEAYNIASRKSQTTIREFAETAAMQSDRSVKYEIPENLERHSFNPMQLAVLSPGKLEQLGWESAYSLEDGIQHTLEILRSVRHGSRAE